MPTGNNKPNGLPNAPVNNLPTGNNKPNGLPNASVNNLNTGNNKSNGLPNASVNNLNTGNNKPNGLQNASVNNLNTGNNKPNGLPNASVNNNNTQTEVKPELNKPNSTDNSVFDKNQNILNNSNNDLKNVKYQQNNSASLNNISTQSETTNSEIKSEITMEPTGSAKLPKLNSVVIGKNGIISTTNNANRTDATADNTSVENKNIDFKSNSGLKGMSAKSNVVVIPAPKKIEEQVKNAVNAGVVSSNKMSNNVEDSQIKKEDLAEEFEDWVGKDLAKSSNISGRQKSLNELKNRLQQAGERNNNSEKVSNDNLYRESEKAKLPNETNNLNIQENMSKASTLVNKPQIRQEQNNENIAKENTRSDSERDRFDNANLGRGSENSGNSSNNSNRNFMTFSQQQSLYNAESAKKQAEMESSNQSNNNLSDVNKTNQMSKQTNVMNSKLASLQQAQQNQGANTNSSATFTGKMTAEANLQQARIDRDQALNSSQTSSVVLERQNSAKAVHAPTNMESTLKKSNKETWSGDEIAAKLIFMLMKASNESMYEHSSRVIDLSSELAQELGVRDPQFLMELKQSAMFSDIGEFNFDLNSMPKELKDQLAEMLETEEVKDAGFLHDVGKVYIPKEILNKPTKLTDEEFEIVKQHPIVGEKMLSGIQGLAHVLPVVRHHHERWDGQGYPDKIGGEEIPYKARIISICDAFDALVSDRPYRQGMSLKEAMAEIKAGAGSQFDPVITDVFLKMVKAKYSV